MLEASSVKLSLSIFTNIADCLAMPAVSSRPSPRSFRQTLVGLGIVAALSDPPEPGEARIAVSPRSSSIPILSPRPGPGKLPAAAAQDDETDDSESYTCVISRRGGGAAESTWEYFSGKLGSFPASPDQSPAGGEEFLSSCNLCRKKLHGLDIFMYRGEKAFCSAECRYQQILSDEMNENCGPEALTEPYESSSSPCSAPRIFITGVVVAA